MHQEIKDLSFLIDQVYRDFSNFCSLFTIHRLGVQETYYQINLIEDPESETNYPRPALPICIVSTDGEISKLHEPLAKSASVKLHEIKIKAKHFLWESTSNNSIQLESIRISNDLINQELHSLIKLIALTVRTPTKFISKSEFIDNCIYSMIEEAKNRGKDLTHLIVPKGFVRSFNALVPTADSKFYLYKTGDTTIFIIELEMLNNARELNKNSNVKTEEVVVYGLCKGFKETSHIYRTHIECNLNIDLIRNKYELITKQRFGAVCMNPTNIIKGMIG